MDRLSIKEEMFLIAGYVSPVFLVAIVMGVYHLGKWLLAI